MGVEDRSAVLADLMSGADAAEETPGASGAEKRAPAEKADGDAGADQKQEVQDAASGAQEGSEGEAVEETPAPEAEDKGVSEPSAEPEDEAGGDASPSDPKVAKALAAIHRQEKRSKDAHQARMAELREVEQTLAGKFEQLKRWEAFQASGSRDPVAVLEALGVDPATMDRAARRMLLRAKAAGAVSDPKLKEQLDKAQYAVELEQQNAEMRQKLDRLERHVFEREANERAERVVNKYLDEVSSAVSTDTPLVASMLKKNPERARMQLREVANELAEELGVRPDPNEVARTLEERRKAELAELGLDYPAPKSESTKPQKTSAGEKQSAKTLRSDMAPSAASKTPFQSREEEVDDVRRRLEAEQLE